MIKVLHVLGALNMGGSETMVINLYEKIDNSKIRFDFAVNGTEIGFLEDQIDKNYSQIFRMTKRSDSFVKHLSDFYKIVKKNSYDIIHYHTQNAFLTSVDISVAKLAGVKKNVVHCHSTQDWRTGIVRKLHKPFRPILNRLTTKKIACGEAAASFLYGTTQNVDILPLPVDCDKYLFNQNKRNELRKQYGVEDNIVIAHVGRFSEVKNHGFLIEIFHEFQKLCPNSILFLIGDGELKSKIEEKAKKAGLSNKIFFWGNVTDVENKLLASDYFVFPSKYEGFPTAVLEAQASGLRCLLSDTITSKIAITDLIEWLSIEAPAQEWARRICRTYQKEIDRKYYNNIIRRKYDTIQVLNKLMDIYRSLL